jgi:hypothetical protein
MTQIFGNQASSLTKIERKGRELLFLDLVKISDDHFCYALLVPTDDLLNAPPLRRGVAVKHRTQHIVVLVCRKMRPSCLSTGPYGASRRSSHARFIRRSLRMKNLLHRPASSWPAQ